MPKGIRYHGKGPECCDPFTSWPKDKLFSPNCCPMAPMHFKKYVLLARVIVAGWPLLLHAEAGVFGLISCERPRSVHDGDTFLCFSGERDFSVRVAGIDAPETGQAFWRVSRDYLRRMVAEGTVVDCYKTDPFERQVCRVKNLDGIDVALELVRSGLAWHTVKYLSEQAEEEQGRYAAAEAAARSRSLGLWSQSDPQEPGECRALRKQRQKCR